MPEIAECYSIAKQIKKISPKKIQKVIITPKFDQYIGDAEAIKQIEKMIIKDIFAYGKSIWFELESKSSHGYLISQLGMTGAWFINQTYNRNDKHNHLIINFGTEQLIYSDPRMFGNIHLYLIPKKEQLGDLQQNIIQKHKWGIDPLLEPVKQIAAVMQKWTKSSKSIKDLMLNQNIVFGIGNYLASEVLAMSSISPFRLGRELTNQDLNKLAKNLINVINKALKYNGYSFAKGYYLPDGSLGQFTDVVKVYEHEGDLCPYCKNGIIKKEFISSRSTYFCTKCQV